MLLFELLGCANGRVLLSASSSFSRAILVIGGHFKAGCFSTMILSSSRYEEDRQAVMEYIAADEKAKQTTSTRLAAYSRTPESADCARINLLKALSAELLKWGVTGRASGT